MAAASLRRLILTITVVAAAMIELVDTSIVNVALSQIGGSLGATLEDVAWVVTAYAIANVIIIPMTSFLAARFGRRPYYIGSILLFTAASVACGVSSNIWELVFFRFVQGIGGGALISTSQAILFEAWPAEKRGLASALFALGIFLGPTLGPTLGGWIIDGWSWPWIFLINVPIGLGAALLSFMHVREPEQTRRADVIDWTGIGLLVVGLGSLQAVLERGEAEDWFSSRWILGLAFVAVVSLVGFVAHELRTPQPVVNLRILKSRSLVVAAALTFVLGFALFASVFIVPVFAQRLLGFTALQTGMLFIPGAVVSIILLPVIGRMLQRGVPPQAMIAVGFAVVGVFALMLGGFNLSTGSSGFFLPVILRVVGLCFLIVPLTQLAVSGLSPADMPQGAALNNMMRQLGGSFGVALVNTYVLHRVAVHRVDLVSHLSPGDPGTEARLHQISSTLAAHGSGLADLPAQALLMLEGAITRQASLLGYLDAFHLVALIAFLSAPLVLIAGRRRQEQAVVPVEAH